MKELIGSLILVCAVVSVLPAQENQLLLKDSRKVLLEATYFGAGMTNPTGSYLIARIFSDGKVQFENSGIKDGSLHHQIMETRVSKKKMDFLKSLLGNENTSNLSSHYKAEYPTIDHAQNLTLKISIGNEMKEITVDNFKPEHHRSRKAYPKGLLQLACIAESARKHSENMFFFKNTKNCLE